MVRRCFACNIVRINRLRAQNSPLELTRGEIGTGDSPAVISLYQKISRSRARNSPLAHAKGEFGCNVTLLVRQEGFEPPTLWFVARYSIQLSYWRVL